MVDAHARAMEMRACGMGGGDEAERVEHGGVAGDGGGVALGGVGRLRPGR